MKQIQWTRRIVELFIDMAMLSDDEAYIIESRAKNTPVSAQAMHLKVSESTIHRMISMLKKKYDAVQKENPDIFPKRKKSAKETWMDTH